MKALILLISTLTLTSATALFAEESNELFSTKQRQEVIRSIDDVCGDTWCEGDYNFKFTDFTCNKLEKNCEVKFHFIKTDEQDVEIYSKLQACHFSNITKFQQIKDSKYSLNENFYEELTNCIGELENNIEF